MEEALGFGKFTLQVGTMGSGKSIDLIALVKRAEYLAQRPEHRGRVQVVKFKPAISERDFEFLSGSSELTEGCAPAIASRIGLSTDCILIKKSKDILEYIDGKLDPTHTKKLVVAIADMQLLDSELYNVLESLLSRKYAVHGETLETDFRRERFIFNDFKDRYVEDIFKLTDEEKIKRHTAAVCEKCGKNNASYTQRLRTYRKKVFNSKAKFDESLEKYHEEIGVPAEYTSPLIVVGAGKGDSKRKRSPEFFYEARCADCHVVPLKTEFLLLYYMILNATGAGQRQIPLKHVNKLSRELGVPYYLSIIDLMKEEKIISVEQNSRIRLLREKRLY